MSRERPRRNLPLAGEQIEKLEKVIEGGNFYGAQQMYKSTSARYISAERFPEALDILHSGASLQLKHGQVTCGAELSVLFVETLVKAKVPCNDESLDRISQIYQLFPLIPVPHNLKDLSDDHDVQELSEALGAAKTHVQGCSSFLKAAIKWSADFGAPRTGAPALHVMLAEYLYSESPELDMAKVSRHFVRGNNPKKFASVLISFMSKCYPGEDDLAIARSILLYLSLGNLKDGNYLMDEVKKQVESKQLQVSQSDLIQFITYLLRTLERDALPLFNMLRSKYKSSIDREPAFHEMLDGIAERFYGVQRPNVLQGMMGDIFKMMGSAGV